MEDQRPLVGIALPISGYTAKVATYYLNEEFDRVDLVRYQGGKMRFVNGETVIDDLPVDFAQKYRNAKVEALVKKLVKPDGAELTVNRETLKKLPQPDYNTLELACDRVFAGLHPVNDEPIVPSKKK